MGLSVRPALPGASQSTIGSGRRAAPREVRAAILHISPNLALCPRRICAGHPRLAAGRPGTDPHSGVLQACRATPTRAGKKRPGAPSPDCAPGSSVVTGLGRARTGAAVAAGDATALTLHAPLPASVSLPCTRTSRTRVVTRATPGFRQAAFALLVTPRPYLRRGSGRGPERPGDPHPASCRLLRPCRRRWRPREAVGNGQGAEPRGGSFLLARTAASSPASAPCTPARQHARAPPLAAPRPQGSESFAFHLGETKRGSEMGLGVQGPKDGALSQSLRVKERMEEKTETPSYQAG